MVIKLKSKFQFLWKASILFFLIYSFSNAQKLDIKLMDGTSPRAIGPAGMSGRVTSIDVVLDNPETIYAGTASGGLWKSENGGIDWEPIFDDQNDASIGAVAVDQRINDVIWVGTGEGNPRNSQTSGGGVYKSIDGGKTWKYLGLEKTRVIHRIIIHPYNSDIVYLAAQGPAWGENPERGIYKTTDGGETWEKVLYVNDKTGAADLIMDPKNPNKLIAAMWEYRRWPWFFESGGEGSGLYVSFDGGKTWKERTHKDGLPKGELGRIGLAISHSNPDYIYALVEAKETGLYRSTDGGFTWKLRAKEDIGNRPFYYADIFVDPKNENRIYNLYSIVKVSEDGGKTFETLIPFNDIHPDHHAFWIHPEDPNFIIDGNDGGLAISRDMGKTWRFVENLPVAQFYHINVDNQKPYYVYGGMQDNGSWRGPSRVFRWGGIQNAYWEELGFGDGFDVVPDPDNPRFGYAMSQGGNVFRYDALTGDQEDIQPVHPEGKELRFNWNAAIAQDPFDNSTIYFGSQYLHKSTDKGDNWKIISPDLTTNDTSKQKQMESGGLTYDVTDAENYTTITAIAPSPLDKNVIWVGTDDGNIQITKDGGETWTNLRDNIDDYPETAWVHQIRTSEYDPSEAFVTVNNYRMNDWKPYAYYTDDYGESWQRLVTEDDVEGYCLSIIQDYKEPNLLFLGTQLGLYVSFDKGETWTKWTKDYPTVPTIDMVFQKDYDDLAVGTFGRSAYIFDYLQPFRYIAQNGIDKFEEQQLKLFDIADAEIRFTKRPAGARFGGDAEFRGENQTNDAVINVLVNPDSLGEDKYPENLKVKIEVFNRDDELIRTLNKKAKRGLNKFVWGLESKGIRFPRTPKPKNDNYERGGPTVLPGEYKVKVTYDEKSDSSMVTVSFDPRVDYEMENLIARKELVAEVSELVKTATKAADRIREAQETVKLVSEKLKEVEKDSVRKNITKLSKSMKDSLKALNLLINQKDVQGIRYDRSKTGAKLRTAYWSAASGYDAPGNKERIYIDKAEESVDETLKKVNDFFEKDWKNYIQKVNESNLQFLKTYKPIEIDKS